MLSSTLAQLLHAIQCQTDPGIISSTSSNSFYHKMASTLLFSSPTAGVCIRSDRLYRKAIPSLDGSFALLWPSLLTLSIARFFDTLVYSLQGIPARLDAGMTVFQHSLAFAEAEVMLLTVMFAKLPDVHDEKSSLMPGMFHSYELNSSAAPTTLLIVTSIAVASQLVSACLAIIGKRDRWRLMTSAVFALLYMAVCIDTLCHPENYLSTEHSVAHAPIICIYGFLPYIGVLLAICLCLLVYGLALAVSILAMPSPTPAASLGERLRNARDNLVANVHFTSSSDVPIDWRQDFYIFLIQFGFSLLTSATQAVFLSEAPQISVHRMTWLERARYKEILQRHARQLHSDTLNTEANPQNSAGKPELHFTSGYARKRPRKEHSSADNAHQHALQGVRGHDPAPVADLIRHTIDVLFRLNVCLFSSLWRKTGLRSVRTSGQQAASREQLLTGNKAGSRRDNNFDFEAEFRTRLPGRLAIDDAAIDATLYKSWVTGRQWGDIDNSGDYSPETDDDDTTSVVSESSVVASEAPTTKSGSLTPTQDSQSNQRTELNVDYLARLLNPQTSSDREDAKRLSQHLQSDSPVTRARYNRYLDIERNRILINPGPDDDEDAMEQFLLETRRAAQERGTTPAGTWANGAAGFGDSGPMCVVCQSSPRNILVWPCGCLCVCDDCRLGVATRNFEKCMCCRTKVTAYSKLYVP